MAVTSAMHFMRGFHASCKVLEFLLENFQDLESHGNDLGPGKSWNFYAVMQMANTMMQTQAPKYYTSVLSYAIRVFTFHDISGLCEFGKCARLHTSNPYNAVIILYICPMPIALPTPSGVLSV